MESKINDHVLKLTGAVSVPEPFEIGHNYKVEISGSITSVTESDNEDGTFNRYYKFQPVLVETIDPKGKRLKAKDPRSMSKKLRASLWAFWKDNDEGMDEEKYYEETMKWIIQNLDMIISARKRV